VGGPVVKTVMVAIRIDPETNAMLKIEMEKT
jgi:hypothetical protein